MSEISPKPVIANVIRVWDVPPGMTFSLVEDAERRIWIMEACPVGTHFWSVEQAAELPQGARTGSALREIISAAHQHIEAQRLARIEEETALPTSSEALKNQQNYRISPLRRQKSRAERALVGVG